MPPGEEVAVYDVTVLPPLESGGEKLTIALPAVLDKAVPIIGAPGTEAGVTAGEGADAGPFPMPFVAVTVKV